MVSEELEEPITRIISNSKDIKLVAVNEIDDDIEKSFILIKV